MENVLSPLVSNFHLHYAVRKVQQNQRGLELYGTRKFLIYADYVNLFFENIS
jgi:hypothetical protein